VSAIYAGGLPACEPVGSNACYLEPAYFC